MDISCLANFRAHQIFRFRDRFFSRRFFDQILKDFVRIDDNFCEKMIHVEGDRLLFLKMSRLGGDWTNANDDDHQDQKEHRDRKPDEK